jgi:hypothetical protein
MWHKISSAFRNTQWPTWRAKDVPANSSGGSKPFSKSELDLLQAWDQQSLWPQEVRSSLLQLHESGFLPKSAQEPRLAHSTGRNLAFSEPQTAARIGQAYWAQRTIPQQGFLHVTCDGYLLGVISAKTQVAAVRRQLTPLSSQTFLGAWKPEGFTRLGPDFCLTNVSTLLWLFGQSQPAVQAAIPPHFWQQNHLLKRIPSVETQLLLPRHWQLLRLFSSGPQSVRSAVLALRLDEKEVRADFSVFYLLGCLQTVDALAANQRGAFALAAAAA